uniref:Inositol-1-monophosphatase n=1 Tax=Chaetoceros debilis TaxID=122233 RepID=A0A7S3VEI8_9STRA|eukprot:CAMPEP_0194109062 /NCGR_PEP_ID=MMETSP0150-20130528/8654_1 /TAXON_ID=122233 /ORGANISM="Chaetoceros debilis, Strain MM31A-1" /LENGTH=356 /DNA_ID=CAMNT_0038797931 /DNA_START=20 /DNA_END=1090 /DNA_ORIENTATION=+
MAQPNNSKIVLSALAVAATGSFLYMKSSRRSNGSTSPTAITSTISDEYAIPPALKSGPYSDELKLAVELALEAGSNMTLHLDAKGTEAGKGAESKLGISTKKNDADFRTAIDVMNEDLVMKGIIASFPDHEIIGEESTGTGEVAPLTDKPTWIIDPIDGTTNFASGCPLTCVSIGLCDGGRPVMGVAFAPATKELYVSIRGKGAYRNGQQIHSTDDDDDDSKTLSNAVVCFEFGYARSEEGVDNMVNAVRRILKHGCRTTRTYGSGVLDLCYVASGRIDVVYTGIAEEGWKPWDYCAAMVIAEESGCSIRCLKSEKDFDKDGNIVPESVFDIYSRSMICGVNTTVVEQCRKIVLDL